MSMRSVLAAGVTSVVLFGVATGVAEAAPTKTHIAGTVQYTTSNGKLHASRAVSVEIRDSDGSTGGALLGTVTTDDLGHFSLDVTTKRPNGKARHPFARAVSRSAGFAVHAPGSSSSYSFASKPVVATGSAESVHLVAGRSTAAGTAFDVADALVTGVRYGRRVAGTLPTVSVAFPDPGGTNATGDLLRVKREDQFDWDVVLHEFGHFVAGRLGIDATPGGKHFFGRNLAEPPRSKADGLHLAWSEGFATYFALTAENVLGVASLEVPGAGDAFYDDTDDATEHVAIGTDAGITSAGEDDELSVARTLWHFRLDAATHIADLTLVHALTAAKVTTLSAAVAALLPAANAAGFDGSGDPSAAEVAHSNDFACTLTRQNVAPSVTSPGDGSTVNRVEPPDFTWVAHGAGPSHRLDRFVVEIFSPDWSDVRFTSKTLTTTSFTPTRSQWKGVVKAGDVGLHVVVRGSSADDPKTGPYDSCAADVAEGGGLTAEPRADTFHPAALNSACLGLALPQESLFDVAGSKLSPSAAYDIVLHAEHGGAPDVKLVGATTDAKGVLPSTLEVLRDVPSGRFWVVIARPRHAGDIRASVQLPVYGFTCYKGDPDTPHRIVWGGVGALPGTTVTEALGGKTLGTATADDTGTYESSYTTSCSGATTALVSYTDLDGPQTISFAVTCPDSRFADSRGGGQWAA